jgi:hypothetical protein
MRSREIYTAIGVGIGMVFLFDHFKLISSSRFTGRIEAQVTFALGAGLVIIVWSVIASKKKG